MGWGEGGCFYNRLRFTFLLLLLPNLGWLSQSSKHTGNFGSGVLREDNHAGALGESSSARRCSAPVIRTCGARAVLGKGEAQSGDFSRQLSIERSDEWPVTSREP